MAIIPTGQKFHTIPEGVNTQERGSALANSQREIYTMQDIIDSVPSGGVTIISIGTTGTNVTGTTSNTITKSVEIPANTLPSLCTLDVIARFTKTLFAGGATYRIYLNTIDSLSGATLISTLQVTPGGGNVPTFQAIRTYFYDGTNLTNNIQASGGNVTDIATQVSALQMSVPLNNANTYWLIFAIQLTNAGDSSVINGYRILKYA